MKPTLRTLLLTVVGFALAVPLSAIVTVVLFPVWSWVESSFGIESMGHSGPAGWCFVAVFASLCVLITGALILAARTRPKQAIPAARA